jgi:dihydroneopterin aldolase
VIDDERDDLDPDEPDEDDDLDDHDDEGSEPLVTIEIVGLSLYTHHGVDEAERAVGQRLVFDLSFDLSDCDATVTDRLEDTIDYGGRAGCAGALVQDARASLLGDRRPDDGPLQRRRRDRPSHQARAADSLAGGRGHG